MNKMSAPPFQFGAVTDELDDDLERAVTGLVEAANSAGGTDNITVLALECKLN